MSTNQPSKNISRPLYRKILFLFAISAILILASYSILEPQYVNASVNEVIARNSTCAVKGKSSRREDCTEFFAVSTAVTSKNQTLNFILFIGSQKGHDIPITNAVYHEGDTIPVAVLPGFSMTEQGDKNSYFIEKKEFYRIVTLVMLCLVGLAYLYRPSRWEIDIDKMNREIEEGEREMENELKKMIEEEEREEQRQKNKFR